MAASSSKDDRPKVHTVRVLPVVNLFVRILKVHNRTRQSLGTLSSDTDLGLGLHTISQQDGQLSDVTKSVLVSHDMIDSIDL